MKSVELENLGLRREMLLLAQRACAAAARAGLRKTEIRAGVRAAVADPGAYEHDTTFGDLARALLAARARPVTAQVTRMGPPAPHRIWGKGLEGEAVAQLTRSCQLPISAAAALMPDAHVGYGLPIGGVLATRGAVIPYAVGVDIACRMRLSVVDLPVEFLKDPRQRGRLIGAIENETRFGVGGSFSPRRDHAVLDADWKVSPITAQQRDKGAAQLGTSGSGNHFVEWGVITVPEGEAAPATISSNAADFGSGWEWNLAPGQYLALLSHSGSRGVGAAVCDYYSRLAMQQHAQLPPELRRLAWLDLDAQPGREYWNAMNLMGQYAAANHACIHAAVIKAAGAEVRAMVENHHNFAWEEEHEIDGVRERVIVHRKGATPAGAGVMGVIPGSMATPGFVVRGRGETSSLMSAAHGAGRVMSRTKAKDSFAWGNVRRELEAAGVELLSAGIDEVPGVYKDIHGVMGAQQDLVDVVARFDPKIVKMAGEGEKAED